MWETISSTELSEEISKAEFAMKPDIASLWQLIKIPSVKWQEINYGKEGNGFWVVAVFGQRVVWYNDIENGFNVSTYWLYGQIDEYYCDQYPLDIVIKRLLIN